MAALFCKSMCYMFVFPFLNCHMLGALDGGIGEWLEYSPIVTVVLHFHIYSLQAKRLLHKPACVKKEGTVMITFSHPRACWQSHQRAPLAATVPRLVHIYSCVRVTGALRLPLPCFQNPSKVQPITIVQETPAFLLLKRENFWHISHSWLIWRAQGSPSLHQSTLKVTPGAGTIHEYEPWHRPLMYILSNFLRKRHLLQYHLHTLVVCVGAKTTMIQS